MKQRPLFAEDKAEKLLVAHGYLWGYKKAQSSWLFLVALAIYSGGQAWTRNNRELYGTRHRGYCLAIAADDEQFVCERRADRDGSVRGSNAPNPYSLTLKIATSNPVQLSLTPQIRVVTQLVSGP
jgi:hypothetical protein